MYTEYHCQAQFRCMIPQIFLKHGAITSVIIKAPTVFNIDAAKEQVPSSETSTHAVQRIEVPPNKMLFDNAGSFGHALWPGFLSAYHVLRCVAFNIKCDILFDIM